MARSSFVRRASRSRLWRWWGLVLVAVMVVGLGGLSVAAYVVMALLVIIWTLFAAPVVWRDQQGARSGSRVLPQQLLGPVAGVLDPRAQVSRIEADLVDCELAGSPAWNLGRGACENCNSLGHRWSCRSGL